MVETKYKSASGPEEIINKRMRNSGGEEADKTIKSGEGVRRVFHNIHRVDQPSNTAPTILARATSTAMRAAPPTPKGRSEEAAMFDGLSGQFEAFVERARAALSQEIAAAKNVVAAASAEKSSAQSVLADLQARTKSAEDQLAAVLSDLQRGSNLAGLNREIATARKTVEKLNAEKAALEIEVAGLAKQRDDGQRELVTLGNQLSRVRQERAEHEGVMAGLRAQLAQVQIGRSHEQTK
jgi:hypothetical protein